jgi:hypothetical protein
MRTKKETFVVPPELLRLIISSPDDKQNEKRLRFIERSRKKLPSWLAMI